MPIPLIDLEALSQGKQLDRLQDACENWGFFQLSGHQVPAADQQRFLDHVKKFFELPAAEKQAVIRTEANPWGYYDRELTKNRQDWKEIFDFGLDQDDPRFPSTSQWPALPGFRENMLTWFHLCEDIALLLLGAIAQTLHIAPATLEKQFVPSHSSFLRLNHYPVCETPADPEELYPQQGNLGISHHTDAGALTVLLQDQMASLQVLQENRWHTVRPIANTFIINVGDLVEVWSNGRYRAPLHRVLANPAQDRYSAPFFYNPSFDAIIQPETNGRAEFCPFNWGEFRALRAAGDYADLGEEVQISQYRLKPDRK